MKKSLHTYSTFHSVSAIFMMLALLWLTISIPFVDAGLQKLAKDGKVVNNGFAHCANDEESGNCFGNTTEEKAPTNSNTASEEYLHDHHSHDHFFSIASQFHSCENEGTYHAYHGELLVPPPNQA
jgi:hypothetical protein